MANGPEGVTAKRDPSLGTSADQRPTLPCHHRAKAAQRNAGLEHQPWERRELCDRGDLRDIAIDPTASLHGGEVSGFAGNRERDATASQTRRPAHEQSCRTLHPETGVNAVIAMREGYDAAELHTLRPGERRHQAYGDHQTRGRAQGRTAGALAGVISSIVRATRSALRRRIAALAVSRAARRFSLSATFRGISRCVRR